MSKLSTVEECVFDMNFESSGVAESLLAVIAKVDNFEEIIKLPIHQISEAIRKNDPNLKFQPVYEIHSKINTDYKVMLGDNTLGISITSADKYTSWHESFFPKIEELFTTIIKSGKINKISRIGLRYIDFLENKDIFKDGKITVNINGQETNEKQMFVRIEGDVNGVSYTKTVTNNTQYKTYENAGSIIDIVTFVDGKENLVDADFDAVSFFKEVDTLHMTHTDKFKEVISDESIVQYEI